MLYEGALYGNAGSSFSIADLEAYRLIAFSGYKEGIGAPNKTTIVFDPQLVKPVNNETQTGIFPSSAKNGSDSWSYRVLIQNPVNDSQVY